MRRAFISTLSLLSSAIVFCANNNTLTINEIATVAGKKQVMLNVSMNNQQSISDVQFDLLLPQGVSITSNNDNTPDISLNMSRTSNNSHSIHAQQQADGTTRVLAVSNSGQAFSGTSGTIITISLDISNTISSGNYNIELKNITLSNDQSSYNTSSVKNLIIIQPTAIATFKLDGEVIQTDTLVVGSEITVPTTQEREGYTFSGWGSIPASMPAYDIEFTATYTINQYRVRFVADGNIIYDAMQNYGSTITIPNAPQKIGHTFTGWGEVANSVPASNVEYIAQYTANRYRLTYLVDGEDFFVDSIEYDAILDSSQAPQAPQKTGYTFKLWENFPPKMPANDITCNANYTINKYAITYIADEQTIRVDSIEYDATLDSSQAPQAPKKTGYTFKQWENFPSKMPANDIICSAKYTINKYKIQFVVDEDIYFADSLTYGAQIVLPQEPEKSGFTFNGWENVPATMPANDVSIVGSFTQKAIKGDVNYDGSVNSADIVSIYNFIAFGEESGISEEDADVNKDGTVNSADIINVYNIIAGGT